MKNKILFYTISGLLLLCAPSCKKCYTCIHPDGASQGYPQREICGKGLMGKSMVEVDRSMLVDEGYNCL